MSAPQGRIFNIAVGYIARGYTLKKRALALRASLSLYFTRSLYIRIIVDTYQSFYQSHRLFCIRKLLRMFVKMWWESMPANLSNKFSPPEYKLLESSMLIAWRF